jgi:hypothetical protein
MLLQVSLGDGISLMMRSSDWKSVGQGLVLFGMRAYRVLREGDRCAAPSTAGGGHADRSEGLPNREFLGSAGSGGVEAGDAWAKRGDVVGGKFQGGTEALVATDWVADCSPVDGVGPEAGDDTEGRVLLAVPYF